MPAPLTSKYAFSVCTPLSPPTFVPVVAKRVAPQVRPFWLRPPSFPPNFCPARTPRHSVVRDCEIAGAGFAVLVKAPSPSGVPISPPGVSILVARECASSSFRWPKLALSLSVLAASMISPFPNVTNKGWNAVTSPLPPLAA